MSALKSLPELEAVAVGCYVRRRNSRTIVSNSDEAHTHATVIAALTSEAINAARETGIGPAEMRRQRDELLATLKEHVDAFDRQLAEHRRDGSDAIVHIAEQVHGRRMNRARAAIAKAEGGP